LESTTHRKLTTDEWLVVNDNFSDCNCVRPGDIQSRLDRSYLVKPIIGYRLETGWSRATRRLDCPSGCGVSTCWSLLCRQLNRKCSSWTQLISINSHRIGWLSHDIDWL